MKNRKLHAIVMGCFLMFLSSNAWGAACAPFGQVGSGTISSPGQTNACTFSGLANNVLDFTMVTTSGSLSPKIQVFNSAGKLIASAAPGFCSGSTIELNTVTLPASDTYTVVASDCSGANTGSYALYMQQTNDPPGALNLPYGQAQAGTINLQAQSDTYTFNANAGDVVDFTLAASGISPKIRVYNPAGQLVGSAAPGFCSGTTVELNTLTLPTSGNYTVLAGDCSDTLTGTYEIYMQRTNSAPGATNLPFGQTQPGTISTPAESNTYTFSANAGDVVDFTLAASGISPKIRVYNPAGQLVGSAAPGFCSGTTVELNTLTLPTSGTYTVLVGDCSDTLTGTYEIYAQRTENPPGSTNLPFGQTQAGTISTAAQSNTYTFGANAGDVVDFTLAASGISPKIRVYNPAGQLVGSAAPGFCSGTTVELNTLALTMSGTYTVLVGDCSDTLTGSYVIYLQRTNNPSGAPMLLMGQTQSGNIASAAQSNSYVFAGSTNDTFDFTLAASGISPKIRLYGPTGLLVSSGAPGFCSGTTFELNTVKVPASGTYTLLVGDCSDTLTGSYVIYAQRTNSPFGPAPFLWGGQTQAGKLTSATQSNTYTFYGSASNSLDLTMTTTSGSVSPKIRLYNPDGTLLAAAAPGFCSGSTIQLNSVTLSQTGIHTVLAGDCADFNTGNYNISGQCFGTCPIMPAITWAMPAPITYPTPLSGTQLNATLSVAGTPAYTPPSGTVLTPGPQNLSVLFTPDDLTNYSLAEDSVQLFVNTNIRVTVSPTSLTFGKQAINTASAPKAVTLTNTGGAPLSISSITVTGNFAISANTCGASLAVGKKCKVSVTFTPTKLGTQTGQLSVSDNAADSPQNVPLTGKGVVQAGVSPTSLTFASQAVGTTSAPKNVTLHNNLAAKLTINSVVFTGANPGDFAETNTCDGSVPAKGKCTISVTFTPTATGARSASLTVSDSANNSPQTAKVMGTGK